VQLILILQKLFKIGKLFKVFRKLDLLTIRTGKLRTHPNFSESRIDDSLNPYALSQQVVLVVMMISRFPNSRSLCPRTHRQWALQSIFGTTGGGQNVSK